MQLLVAPAAAGKTAHALARARHAAQGLQAMPRVVVPTHLQAHAWRRRLARSGGALGVRLLTFDQLYADCLNAAGEAYTRLDEPVQYRLIRAVVDGLRLVHYAPLTSRPGFIQVLQGLMGELKAARIEPGAFARAAGDEPRLRELALIYDAYQRRLQDQGWADRAGLGWLALESLEQRAPAVACDWPLLIVDGFDNLTTVQLDLLRVLAGRVGELLITLTGDPAGEPRPFVHRRFDRTRRQLEEILDIMAAPLPGGRSHSEPVLAHLEAGLFRSQAGQVAVPAPEPVGQLQVPARAIELLEAPDRAAEARAALRWLKACLVGKGMGPGDVALLARDVEPYRSFILQTAAEFGLPVRLLGGLPLKSNPAIAALLDLLRLVLPRSASEPEFALPRRPVVEAWRSPYFDWSTLESDGAGVPGPGDADDLDAAARYGSVIGGLSQWTGVLDRLAALPARATEEDEAAGAAGDEELGLPAGVPTGPAAWALGDKFKRFVGRLRPPAGPRTYREFVCWLEELIGPDPELQPVRFPVPEETASLRVVERARDARPEVGERDVAALRALKDVLRGLVWAEEALSSATGQPLATGLLEATGPLSAGGVNFPRFFDELAGAIEAASYQLPAHPDRAEIVVAPVVQARGVPFRAVAVLGLAEGEFPATLGEDPFLRDADRRRMREEHGLPLDPSTLSAEFEFFYETVTRPRERLLLTRPRLAENGAEWQASPFWEEVRRLVDLELKVLTSESLPPPAQVASWPELMDSLAAHPAYIDVRAWVARTEPDRQAAVDAAVDLLRLRRARAAGSPFEGDLAGLGDDLARRLGPRRSWSASRLETYRTCPFFFFVAQVLYLEPRPEPAEGLDARQLGNIYHHILEQVHQHPGLDDPADLDQVLAVLPGVAGTVLDAAPEQEGFRATAWWAHTRDEILENVRRSLEALAALPGGYAPALHEAVFGREGQSPLVVRQGADSFQMGGYIDRVDRAPDGRLRVIDYKTAGPSSFTKKAVADGKKLQLPLYALAARDALGLGQPAEGFYWHVQQAEPSAFQMSRFDDGPEAAMEVAVEKAWEAVRGARDGHFAPEPPQDGCPAYCPAAAFCWHFRPRFGG